MIDKNELQRIRVFTGKSETDKAFRTLEGILKGIALDKIVNVREIHELKNWCGSHVEFIDRHPFNEVIPMIMGFIEDNELDEEEYEDLIWMTESITGNSIYYNAITGDIQVLHGILHGIMADNIITDIEANNLRSWLNANVQLKGTFPYDELFSLLEYILADGKITSDEAKMLKAFISEFIPKENTSIDLDNLEALKNEMHISGICVQNPCVKFDNKLFCFTGASEKGKRSDIEKIVIEHGAIFSNNVIKNLDYLVVGNAGNPCWAFSCYGRKVEQAIAMRREGLKVQLINENDFWKAI